MIKWKRRVVGFTAVTKKRSIRVLLLFGGDRVEKPWNIFIGKADRGLRSKSSGLQQLSRLTVRSCQWRLKLVVDNNVYCSELAPLLFRLY